jgi:hypothetical protein
MIENYTDMRNDIANNDPKKPTKVESSDISTKNTDPEKSLKKTDTALKSKDASPWAREEYLKSVTLKVRESDSNKIIAYNLDTPKWAYDFINRNNRYDSANAIETAQSLDQFIDTINASWKTIDKQSFKEHYLTQLDIELQKKDYTWTTPIDTFVTWYENLRFVLNLKPGDQNYTQDQRDLLDTYMLKFENKLNRMKFVATHDWYDGQEKPLIDKFLTDLVNYSNTNNKRYIYEHFKHANSI